MRRIINMCFVALAICAVVYGLVLKYGKEDTKLYKSGVSNSSQTIKTADIAPPRILPTEELSVPQN